MEQMLLTVRLTGGWVKGSEPPLLKKILCTLLRNIYITGPHIGGEVSEPHQKKSCVHCWLLIITIFFLTNFLEIYKKEDSKNFEVQKRTILNKLVEPVEQIKFLCSP